MRTALTRDFARHYAEMVVVMLVGMGLLSLPARWATDALWPALDGDDSTLMLARMAVAMTLPMVPWMRPDEYSHPHVVAEPREQTAAG
jgi:hypothetical protein